MPPIMDLALNLMCYDRGVGSDQRRGKERPVHTGGMMTVTPIDAVQ
jgi:hypothetical protein